jgi:hypothetical protein
MGVGKAIQIPLRNVLLKRVFHRSVSQEWEDQALPAMTHY